MNRQTTRVIGQAILVLALLLLSATPVFADSSAGFAGASFIEGKGLVLYFSIPGTFDLADAPTFVAVNGINYSLTCRIREDGLLACTAAIGKATMEETAVVGFGGREYSFVIHESRPAEGTQSSCSYSYPYYHWDSSNWVLAGTLCQDSGATNGDFNDYSGVTYIYLTSGPVGDGYYELR